MAWIYLVDFLPVFKERQFLLLPFCFSEHKAPSEKGFTLKGNKFVRKGYKYFSLRLNPFSGGGNFLIRVFCPENVLVPHKFVIHLRSGRSPTSL